MSLYGNLLGRLERDLNPQLPALVIVQDALNKALWAEGQLNLPSTSHTDMLRCAFYRDACLSIIANATGRPSQVWLDEVRAVALDDAQGEVA